MSVKYELPSNQITNWIRYNELFLKGSSRTGAEVTEFNALNVTLANYLISAADWNGLSNEYIPLSLILAAGDLIIGTGVGDATPLSKGANGTVLTVDGSGNVIWQAPTVASVVLISGTTAGGTTAYTLTPSTALTSYTTNLEITIIMNATNTGSSTINISSLGAKSLKKIDGSELLSGDLVIGQPYTFVYNATEFRSTTEIRSQSTTNSSALIYAYKNIGGSL